MIVLLTLDTLRKPLTEFAFSHTTSAAGDCPESKFFCRVLLAVINVPTVNFFSGDFPVVFSHALTRTFCVKLRAAERTIGPHKSWLKGTHTSRRRHRESLHEGKRSQQQLKSWLITSTTAADFTEEGGRETKNMKSLRPGPMQYAGLCTNTKTICSNNPSVN